MDNGISGYLTERNKASKKNPFTFRFFYDEIGNLINLLNSTYTEIEENISFITLSSLSITNLYF